MAFKPTTNTDSRNILTTGVVQQLCSSGTIRSTKELSAWVAEATNAYDKYLNTDKLHKALNAFAVALVHLSKTDDLRDIQGDPSNDKQAFAEKYDGLYEQFRDFQELRDTFQTLLKQSEERLMI